MNGWIQSLFTTCFQPKLWDDPGWCGFISYITLLRIIDLFTLYGCDVLLIVSIALMQLYQRSLIQMNRPQLESFLNCDTHDQQDRPAVIGADELVTLTLKLWKQSSFKVTCDILPKTTQPRAFLSTTLERSHVPGDEQDLLDRMQNLADEANVLANVMNMVPAIKGRRRYSGKELSRLLQQQYHAFLNLF